MSLRDMIAKASASVPVQVEVVPVHSESSTLVMLPHQVGKVAHAVANTICKGSPRLHVMKEVLSNSILLSLALKESTEDSVESYVLGNASMLFFKLKSGAVSSAGNMGEFLITCEKRGLLDSEYCPTPKLLKVLEVAAKYESVPSIADLQVWRDANPQHPALVPTLTILDEVPTRINSVVLDLINEVRE